MTSEAPAPPSPLGILPTVITDELPAIIRRAGSNAVFAAQEFFLGKIRNEHTRRAYQHAVKQFLAWIEKHGGGAGANRSLAGRQILRGNEGQHENRHT